MNKFQLSPDRFFSPDPSQRSAARELFESIKDLPLICPHGHVDPRLFADPDYQSGSPTELLLIPDHYVFRMLYSQGYTLETFRYSGVDGSDTESESDHRKIWQIFADNFYLFRGTPTGIWLTDEFVNVFEVDRKIDQRQCSRNLRSYRCQTQITRIQPADALRAVQYRSPLHN